MLCTTALDSPVGALTLVANDTGLAAVLWQDDRPSRVVLGPLREASDHPILDQASRELTAYFTGTRRDFTVPLAPIGTPFQQSVWNALRTIPHGETRSYAAIAQAIARPTATRAVGAANGRNPISIIIPCHRVIGASGALTGFAGGLEAKRWLLAHEQKNVA